MSGPNYVPPLTAARLAVLSADRGLTPTANTNAALRAPTSAMSKCPTYRRTFRIESTSPPLAKSGERKAKSAHGCLLARNLIAQPFCLTKCL